MSGESDPPDEQAARGDSFPDVPPTLKREGLSTLGLTPDWGAGRVPGQPQLSPGEQLAGRFTVLRFVARGGMGAVYEATDEMLRARVALKVLDGRLTTDEAMERFRREVLLARRVSHPNVCRVYELFQATTAAGWPVHFLTMEFLDGETLTARIRREGRLGSTEALPLIQQMCDGLAAAHAEGVIHRDFKSGNVMLVPHPGVADHAVPRVAITDFGIARALEQRSAPGDEALTGRSSILGTPEYMAPEQLTGSGISPATDVYALGVVIYEMVTGRLPFPADTPLARAVRQIKEAPPRPELVAPDLDPPWGRTILRCLEWDPHRRFQHPRDVVAALSDTRPRRRWLLPAALVGVVLLILVGGLVTRHLGEGSRSSGVRTPASPPSIAVLPFVDMSPDHNQEYFSDGVAQEIISALAQVPGLHVVARSSSFSFKGKNEDLRSVGQKLNVLHVLEGSVRKSGDRLRVSAQVVNTIDGYQLWSQTFDRELVDIFAVQDEIAHAVVTALRIRVLPEQDGKGSELRATSPEVYAIYLRGLQFRNSGSLTDLRRAIEEYRKAIALDPNYAPAHAALASSLLWYGTAADESEVRQFDSEWRRHGLEGAERAVALNPQIADGYRARAAAHLAVTWDWAAARRDLEQTLALAPGDTAALGMYAYLLAVLGRQADAVPYCRLAVELDPLSAGAYYRLGFLYNSLGQYAAARVTLEKAVALAPGHFFAHARAFTELLDGNPAKALAIFRAHPQQWVQEFGAALSQYSLGDDAASRRALKELMATSSQGSPYQIAEVYAWRGERDSAFEWLERAYAGRDPGVCDVKADPFLRSLHGDPRLGALLAKLRLPPD